MMHLREDRAREKWCPFVRFVIGPQDPRWQGNAYTNRGEDFEERGVGCLGSGCALWQPTHEGRGYCGMGRS